MALAARKPAAGLVHHPDRGCQDTAGAYQAALAAQGIAVSMSRAGDCYANAMAERCFATRKVALVDTRPWPPRRAARLAICAWIEAFYNRQRSHSALVSRIAGYDRGLITIIDHLAPLVHAGGPPARSLLVGATSFPPWPGRCWGR